MTTYVDQLTTEVTAEPESAPQEGHAEGRWGRLDRLRADLAALQREGERTHAEGFDD
jgi:hypothetical protein